MPYYNAGDYYGRSGDYYQGGDLFGFIKKIGKAVAGGVTGFIKGGPIGAAVGVGKAITGPMIQEARSGVTYDPTAVTLTSAQRGAALQIPMMAPPAPTGGPSPYGGGGMAMIPYGGGRHRATHPNKSTYVTRGGGTSHWPQQLAVHEKGTELVTSRRMNVGNARALRRALRRARGFAKLARRAGVIMHAYRGGGKARKKK